MKENIQESEVKDPVQRDYILIQDIAENDRPREKALRLGIHSLDNAELMAIIFGNGMRGKSVLTMSQQLLAKNKGSLLSIARKPIKTIVRENPGIGPAKAIALAAAIELGMRCHTELPPQRPKLTGSDSVYKIMKSEIGLLDHEEFWVMMLSRSGELIGKFCLSSGGSSATVVDLKLLFKRILTEDETVQGIILAHNHPSGNLMPSSEDCSLTRRIKEGAKMLDIQVLDHIIIAHTGYYSFTDEGKL
ncbi:MAG: DNA repair protein RadC [Muribaculum sp.]|nr:DNA repair protein RadC [Muribaculaceae bacterium]MCM1080882.1 DNA repair protein RadC [Muribaculum sp.]